MAVPAAIAADSGVPYNPHFNTDLYTEVWENGIQPTDAGYMANISLWNWGVTDPDMCCDDGFAPSYMLHTLSRQGAPQNFTGKSWNMAGLLRSNLTQYEWLESYF